MNLEGGVVRIVGIRPVSLHGQWVLVVVSNDEANLVLLDCG